MEKILLCSVEKQADKAKEGVITFALTTKDVDRDGDVIEPKGAQLNHFLSNPVFLWAHDHRRPPIGRVMPETITITDSAIYADVQFDLNDPFAKLIYEKYKSGFLNAGSIRFRPLEYEPRRETQTDENGEERMVEIGGWHIKKWELLEFSAVPIPANPMALAQKDAFDPADVEIDRLVGELAVAEKDFDEAVEAWVKSLQKEEDTNQSAQNDDTEDPVQKKLDELQASINELAQTISELAEQLKSLHSTAQPASSADGAGDSEPAPDNESKSVVPFRATPKAPEGRSWDKTAAINRIRKWASSDGSGDKDKINWSKYRQAFAWYDTSDPENFGSYKLPHHDVENGQLVVVWAGVRAAMAALMGARGGVNIPDSDRRGVYNHLSKHYKQFEKEPPDFKDLELLESPEEFVADLILNNEEVQNQIIERVVEILTGDGSDE